MFRAAEIREYQSDSSSKKSTPALPPSTDSEELPETNKTEHATS
jgi:hypothetical protein